jgi:hypothetical protein
VVKIYASLLLGVPSENAQVICLGRDHQQKDDEEIPEQKDNNIQQAGFPDGHPL